MSINQAHLLHDCCNRSSTRVHAPPGGKSSMGSSFGWEEPQVYCLPSSRLRHNSHPCAQTEARPVQRRNPNASSFDVSSAEPHGQSASSAKVGHKKFISFNCGSGLFSVVPQATPGGNSSISFGGPTPDAPRPMARFAKALCASLLR